jgi:hypothetical protein
LPIPSRFEANYNDPVLAFEPLIDEVFAELKSSFLEMPRGDGFVDYPTFERGYQELKRSTKAFANVTNATVEAAVEAAPIAFIVFRAILGFTPPEWAYLTTEMSGVTVDQGAARSIDRNMRLQPLRPRPLGTTLTGQRIKAMIDAGVKTLHFRSEHRSGDGPSPARQGRHERRREEPSASC